MNYKKTSKLLKAYSLGYWLIYIIKTYFIWEFTNPFWWMLQLPKNSEIRLNVFMITLMLLLFFIIAYHILLDENGKINKNL